MKPAIHALARLNTRLHLMVSVTPVLYEPFPLDSACESEHDLRKKCKKH